MVTVTKEQIDRYKEVQRKQQIKMDDKRRAIYKKAGKNYDKTIKESDAKQKASRQNEPVPIQEKKPPVIESTLYKVKSKDQQGKEQTKSVSKSQYEQILKKREQEGKSFTTIKRNRATGVTKAQEYLPEFDRRININPVTGKRIATDKQYFIDKEAVSKTEYDKFVEKSVSEGKSVRLTKKEPVFITQEASKQNSVLVKQKEEEVEVLKPQEKKKSHLGQLRDLQIPKSTFDLSIAGQFVSGFSAMLNLEGGYTPVTTSEEIGYALALPAQVLLNELTAGFSGVIGGFVSKSPKLSYAVVKASTFLAKPVISKLLIGISTVSTASVLINKSSEDIARTGTKLAIGYSLVSSASEGFIEGIQSNSNTFKKSVNIVKENKFTEKLSEIDTKRSKGEEFKQFKIKDASKSEYQRTLKGDPITEQKIEFLRKPAPYEDIEVIYNDIGQKRLVNDDLYGLKPKAFQKGPLPTEPYLKVSKINKNIGVDAFGLGDYEPFITSNPYKQPEITRQLHFSGYSIKQTGIQQSIPGIYPSVKNIKNVDDVTQLKPNLKMLNNIDDVTQLKSKTLIKPKLNNIDDVDDIVSGSLKLKTRTKTQATKDNIFAGDILLKEKLGQSVYVTKKAPKDFTIYKTPVTEDYYLKLSSPDVKITKPRITIINIDTNKDTNKDIDKFNNIISVPVKNILKTDVKQNVITRSGILYDTKTDVKQETILIIKPEPKTIIETRTRTRTRTKTKTKTKTKTDIIPKTIIEPKIIIQSKPKIITSTPIKTIIKTKINPNIFNIIKPSMSRQSNKNIMGGLFSVKVRKKGKWINLNSGIGYNYQEATQKGLFAVGTSARASFKLVKASKGTKKKRFYGRGVFTDFYTKGNIHIEKRERRIKSKGEKEQITLKGQMALRTKSIFNKILRG